MTHPNDFAFLQIAFVFVAVSVFFMEGPDYHGKLKKSSTKLVGKNNEGGDAAGSGIAKVRGGVVLNGNHMVAATKGTKPGHSVVKLKDLVDAIKKEMGIDIVKMNDAIEEAVKVSHFRVMRHISNG